MTTAINPSQLWKKRLGDWVLNPYVGCEHGCFHCYCPAMPGVKFMNHGHSQREWGKYLYPKPGLVEALRDQLRNFTPDRAKRTEWGDGWILMSFLTDCYTPSEAKHKLTRQCLQLLLEAGHKVRVQTRSVLVERDFDLLAAHADRVLLGTSLPHLDDKLARALEPRRHADFGCSNAPPEQASPYTSPSRLSFRFTTARSWKKCSARCSHCARAKYFARC